MDEYERPRSLGQEVKAGATWMLGLVGLLWGIEVVNLLSGHQLLQLGILPRTVVGLRGLVFAPFLHGGLAHLLANTLPLLVLGALVLARGRSTFIRVTAFVALVGGLLTWILGRPTLHVGSSGLIFGYFGYLIGSAWYERRPLPILLAVLATTLYGGILWGLLPVIPGVSWEGHLFGLIAGVLAARVAGRSTRRGLPASPRW